jgi:hypothetical protein
MVGCMFDVVRFLLVRKWCFQRDKEKEEGMIANLLKV